MLATLFIFSFSGRHTVYPTFISNISKLKAKELSEKSIKLLDDIVKTCNEKGIKIIFYSAPTSEPFYYAEAVTKYADDNNCYYVNFYEKYKDAGIDPKTDFSDWDHLNTAGAKKLANYLGQFIIDNKIMDMPN